MRAAGERQLFHPELSPLSRRLTQHRRRPASSSSSSLSLPRGEEGTSHTLASSLVADLWARFRERTVAAEDGGEHEEEREGLTAAGLAALLDSLKWTGGRRGESAGGAASAEGDADLRLYDKFCVALGLSAAVGARPSATATVGFARFSAVFTAVFARAIDTSAATTTAEDEEKAKDGEEGRVCDDPPAPPEPTAVSDESAKEEEGDVSHPSSSARSSPAPRPPVSLFAPKGVGASEPGPPTTTTRMCSSSSCSPFASPQAPGLSASPAQPSPPRRKPTRPPGKAHPLPASPPRVASATTRSFELKRAEKRSYDPQRECTFTPQINKQQPPHRGAIRFSREAPPPTQPERERRVVAFVDVDGIPAGGEDAGGVATITVREGDRPRDLARAFCAQHGLGREAADLLEKMLSQRLGELLTT